MADLNCTLSTLWITLQFNLNINIKSSQNAIAYNAVKKKRRRKRINEYSTTADSFEKLLSVGASSSESPLFYPYLQISAQSSQQSCSFTLFTDICSKSSEFKSQETCL